MNLIDKNELDKLVGEPFEKFLSRLNLKCPKTVKAIPIEWIKKYMDKVDIEDCGMVYLSPSGLLRDMLKDWEKEHEAN